MWRVVLGVSLLTALIALAVPTQSGWAQVEVPVATEQLTVHNVGVLHLRTGKVTLSGTVTCPVGADGYVLLGLSQGDAAGSGRLALNPKRRPSYCTGQSQPWTKVVKPSAGRFTRAGRSLNAYAQLGLALVEFQGMDIKLVPRR